MLMASIFQAFITGKVHDNGLERKTVKDCIMTAVIIQGEIRCREIANVLIFQLLEML